MSHETKEPTENVDLGDDESAAQPDIEKYGRPAEM